MIYSFARSLDITLDFEDRPFNLGEIVSVKVKLNAKRKVTVRNGLVIILYEVRWIANYPDYAGAGPRARNKQIEKEASYVLGSAKFLGHKQLEPLTSESYHIELDIHKDDPPYSYVEGALMGWSISAVVDIAMGLDVRTRKGLEVRLD